MSLSVSSMYNRSYSEPSSCCTFPLGRVSESKHQQQSLNKPDRAKANEIDLLMATAMNGLSFEERQRQLEIVHGVSTEVEESDEMISSATAEFLEHLKKLKAGTAYETAERMNASFVNDREFQLMFLRGNEFSAKRAADQVIKFLDIKQRLFGTEKLTKEITLRDLNEDDRDFLKTGTIQLIGKDRMDRVIWFNLPSLRKFKTIENEVRARFYMAMSLLKSEQVQRKGLVTVNYAVGEFRDSLKGEGYVDVVSLMLALPFNHASFHNCVGTNAFENMIGKAALALIPASLRTRVRIQFGSHLETQYTLTTFGIFPHLFPITPMTNKVRLDNHLQWYAAALARETGKDERDDTEMDTDASAAKEAGSDRSMDTSTDSNPRVLMTLDVKRYDVLYDYGRTVKHEGNELVRTLVRDQSASYDASSIMGKREVVEQIIRHLHGKGGRFLKIDEASGGYTELDIVRVRSKVSQMFRNNRRPRGNTVLRMENDASQDPAATSLPSIDRPGPYDVVLGRVGKGKGNELMLMLVKKHGDQYDGSTRGEKSTITDSIVQQIKSEGGRFVQPQDEGGWEEIPNEVARSKVAKCFRNSRRTKAKVSL